MENKSLLIWKIAIASTLSWEIAKLAGSHHPYLAPITVILCLQSTINQSIMFSFHRITGTILGMLVTELFAPYLQVNGWTIGLLVFAGGIIAKWLKRNETTIHQAALTVLLIFEFEHKQGTYPIDRFRDTIIGAIITIFVHMIISPPNFTKQASKSCKELQDHLSAVFTKASNWVSSGIEKGEGIKLQVEVKNMLKEIKETKYMVDGASESLKYNPFGKQSKKKLNKYQQKIYYIELGNSYLTSILNKFNSWKKSGNITSSQQDSWREQLLVLGQFFQTKENLAEWIKPGDILKVNIPAELAMQQFHLSLFQETEQFINKLS